jgi:hypothetical protein
MTKVHLQNKWAETNNSVCALLRQAHDVLALTSLPMEKVRNPLTDEEMDILCDAYLKCQEESPEMSGIYGLIRAVERAHGIGVKE